jgi:hypothetical protein
MAEFNLELKKNPNQSVEGHVSWAVLLEISTTKKSTQVGNFFSF